MSRRRISQAEAHRLRKQVKELQNVLKSQRSDWSQEWPEGACISAITPTSEVMATIKTARLLAHAVVALPRDSHIRFYALRLP